MHEIIFLKFDCWPVANVGCMRQRCQKEYKLAFHFGFVCVCLLVFRSSSRKGRQGILVMLLDQLRNPKFSCIF